MKKKMKIVLIISCLLMTATLLSCLCACNKTGKFDENKNISVVTRTDGSGTKSAIMEFLGLKGKKDVSGAIVLSSTDAIMAEVKGNPLAIGYDSLGFVTDDVKKIKVDGVAPTVENIKSGAYRLARPLNIVYKEENVQNGLNKAFFDFLKSSDAEKIIANEGYVVSHDDTAAYQIQQGLSGTINITGSTSLTPLMEKLAKKFEQIQGGVSINVGGTGSSQGYNDAKNGVVDFGMISEVFKPAKAEGCTYYEVCLDGIAIIVNSANPIENVSLATLKNIYDVDAGENAVKTWKQASAN